MTVQRSIRSMRLYLASFVLAFCALPLFAQQGDQLYTATRLQLDVTKILIAQENAWNKGDLEGYLSNYKDATDTQAILAGPVRGLNNIRAAFRANYPSRDSMGTLENSEIEVKALGESFALATGRYHLIRSRKAGGETQGGFTEVLEKTAAGWKVIYSETT